MTGKRELRPEFQPGYQSPFPNPLDQKQFPDPAPGNNQRRQPGLPPFELPSDYPVQMSGGRRRPGAGLPHNPATWPGETETRPDPLNNMPHKPSLFDPGIDIDETMRRNLHGMRQDMTLRSALESKKLEKRKQQGMEEAMQRRSRRSGRRVFRDPQNLARFAGAAEDRRYDRSVQEMRDQQPIDMDDTIVESGGQQYRYDSEVDKFTPVNFNPRTNSYESALPDEKDKKKSGGGGGGGGGGRGSQTDAFKVAKSNFDKQMTELRKLSETDEQFGDTYREFQQEYNEILRSPDLRPEERDAALTDLFDRGAETFEQTSGYRRQAAEAEQKQRSETAKAKRDEEMQYKNRRALEAKDQIRRQQENARYEDRKVRQKHSETTQNLDKAYAGYKEQFEAQQAGSFAMPGEEEKPLSLEEFTAKHYRTMHEDEAISDEIRSVDGNLSILETELGQLQDEDPLAYRDQLTEIYGQGRQEEADAAFQDYQNTRAAKIAGVTRRIGEMKAQRKELMDSKSNVYDEKYRSATAVEERRNRNLTAISETQKVQEEERPGTLGYTFLNRGARQMEEIQEGTRKVAAGTEKLATREAMLQRDSNPMSPTFGQSTRTDSPEYIADLSGDRTLLGSLRRLAESENDPAKRKKYGGEDVYKQQRLRAIQAIEKVIQKESPAGSDEAAGIDIRTKAVERLNQIMRFEQSLDKEQMGGRG